MDMSKLPRMSKTPAPPGDAMSPQGEGGAAPDPRAGGRAGDLPPARQPGAAAGQAGVKPCTNCGMPLRAGARFCDGCGGPVAAAGAPASMSFAEAWISIAIGIVLLLIYPNMVKYASHEVFHTPFAPFADEKGNPSDAAHMTKLDDNGNVVVTEIRPYPATTPENNPNFWSDLSVTAFGLALIVEGVALVLSRRPAVVMFAIVITLAATLLNLAYVVGTFSKYGIAMISTIAVIFGFYMTVYQFNLYRWAKLQAAR